MSDSREAAWGTGFRQPGGLLYLWASNYVNQVIYSWLNHFFYDLKHKLTDRRRVLQPWDFPGGSGVKNPPASGGDEGLILGWGRCPGGGNGNPLEYSCLGNPMDRGAWQAAVRGIARVRHSLAIKLPYMRGHRSAWDLYSLLTIQ